MRPEIWWLESKCIGEKDCVQTCPKYALSLTPEGIHIDRKACDGCGKCVEACPAQAIELLGKPWSPEDMVNEAWKDRLFFQNSGGGVTLSGGEPTIHADFVCETFRLLHERGIHTALDTCGFALAANLQRILEHTDLVLYDLKEINSGKHQEFTGVPNERLLETLCAVRDFRNSQGKNVEIWIRTPLVPNCTASKENIAGIAGFLRAHMGKSITRWELCAFNNLCGEKYARLNQEWPLKSEPLLDQDLARSLLNEARSPFEQPDFVRLTGLV